MSDNKELQIISTENIKDKIYTIRGVQVMLDSDLSQLYGYETKNFNRQVKNNIEKFPSDLMFQLNEEEIKSLSRCKKFTTIMQSKGVKGGRVYLPYAFTEQGIYMLMTVLKGELATRQSLMLVRTFKAMRHYLIETAPIYQRLDRIELNQLEFKNETDKKFEEVFKQLDYKEKHIAYLFFSGQLFDAKKFIDDLIATADKEITLIDNYTDFNTLSMLKNKKNRVYVKIITTKRNGINKNDVEVESFKKQYGNLEIIHNETFHGRFLIIDRKELYSLDGSIKDAGSKTIAINKIEEELLLKELLKNIE